MSEMPPARTCDTADASAPDPEDSQSITDWIDALKKQDSRAATAIWQSYHQRLIQAVRFRMTSMSRREADEEDVAISAFQSFYSAVEGGRLPKLDDQRDLWRVLVTIASRKVATLRKRQTAIKRGAGKLRGESIFQVSNGEEAGGLAQFSDHEPSPEMVMCTAEAFGDLLNRLPDETLRRVAKLKLENYTSAEIARQLGCVERTVERKLERIRAIWQQNHS